MGIFALSNHHFRYLEILTLKAIYTLYIRVTMHALLVFFNSGINNYLFDGNKVQLYFTEMNSSVLFLERSERNNISRVHRGEIKSLFAIGYIILFSYPFMIT